MENVENAPKIVQWLVDSGILDYFKENFSVNQTLIIFGIIFILIVLFLIFIIGIIIRLFYKKFGKGDFNSNKGIIKSLGRTDEEKFIHIMEMKNTKKVISKIILVIYIISAIVFAIGISKGAMSGDIWMLAILYIVGYIYMVHILGTGIAWFAYFMRAGDYSMPELEDEKKQREDIVEAYILGGRRLAGSVAIGSYAGDIISLIIGFLIGYIIGWINAIAHFGEINAVKKRIKKKYKNKNYQK